MEKPKSTQSLEQLLEMGRSYMNTIGDQLDSDKYQVNFVVDQTYGYKGSDGQRPWTASWLAPCDPEIAEPWLDRPLYSWNGSLAEPRFSNIINPLVSTKECSPQAIVNLGTGILEGHIPCVPEIKDTLLERIGAIFLAGASLRQLVQVIEPTVNLVIQNREFLDVHSLAAGLFHKFLADQQIVILDIHDLWHAEQVKQWPDFFSQLGAVGDRAFNSLESLPPKSIKHAQRLCSLLVDVVFEESLVSTHNELHSFGCLNWQSPTGTPVAPYSSNPNLSAEDLKLSQRWHTLWALRTHIWTEWQASQALGMELNWLEQLGYDADESFKHLAAQSHPASLVRQDPQLANHVEVQAPSTPTELIHRATQLFKSTGLL